MINNIETDIAEVRSDIIVLPANCNGRLTGPLSNTYTKKYPKWYPILNELCSQHNYAPEQLLGICQAVKVDRDTNVANIICQYTEGNRLVLDYEAMDMGFDALKNIATVKYEQRPTWRAKKPINILVPYGFGCISGIGDWRVIYTMLIDKFRFTDTVVNICRRPRTYINA